MILSFQWLPKLVTRWRLEHRSTCKLSALPWGAGAFIAAFITWPGIQHLYAIWCTYLPFVTLHVTLNCELLSQRVHVGPQKLGPVSTVPDIDAGLSQNSLTKSSVLAQGHVSWVQRFLQSALSCQHFPAKVNIYSPLLTNTKAKPSLPPWNISSMTLPRAFASSATAEFVVLIYFYNDTRIKKQ